MEKLYLKTPQNFSFKSTIYSHGWSDLEPFNLHESPLYISYVSKTTSEAIHLFNIKNTENTQLEITLDSKVTDPEKENIFKIVRRMFRLDEDFSEFYELAGRSNEFDWVVKYNAGRLLRCGSLWEDMVKMLCTTNCTWRLTQIMTENLVKKLGASKKTKKTGATINAFPRPQDIANQTEDYLRIEIKMGYRAPYLLEFAKAIANDEINLDEFEDNGLPTGELYKKIRQIKGFGDYAVSNLLKLLGRYDFMGADSWSRKKFYEKHHKGKAVDDKKILSHYKKYNNWAGLFFWIDVSEDWYKQEIPW
jgi:N-glycosylase/DNA lyase